MKLKQGEGQKLRWARDDAQSKDTLPESQLPLKQLSHYLQKEPKKLNVKKELGKKRSSNIKGTLSTKWSRNLTSGLSTFTRLR